MKRTLFFLVFALTAPSAFADLVECDGTWTNKECKIPGGRVLDEQDGSPKSHAEIEAGQKKLWIEQLDLRRYSAGTEQPINVDISAERSLCLDPTTTLSDCRDAIDKKLKQIDEMILAALQLEAAKKKAMDETSSKSEERGDRDITIVQNQNEYHHHRRPLYERPGYYDPPPYESPTAAPLGTPSWTDRLNNAHRGFR